MIQSSLCFLLSVHLCLLMDKWSLKFGVSNKTQASLSVHKLLEPQNVSSWGQSRHFIYFWDPDAEKDWGWKEKRAAEDEMVRWHHWLNGHESEQTPGDREDRGARRAAVHGVTKSQTRLGDWAATVALQCCVSLCCTMRHMHTNASVYARRYPLPLGPPSHPSGSPQGTELSSLCYIATSH